MYKYLTIKKKGAPTLGSKGLGVLGLRFNIQPGTLGKALFRLGKVLVAQRFQNVFRQALDIRLLNLLFFRVKQMWSLCRC